MQEPAPQTAATIGDRTAPAVPLLLQVSLFGPLRAVFAGQEVRIRSRKARALLGYLLLTEGGEETRERLVGLLWSRSDEEKARASLRQVVHELREALEAAGCMSRSIRWPAWPMPGTCWARPNAAAGTRCCWPRRG